MNAADLPPSFTDQPAPPRTTNSNPPILKSPWLGITLRTALLSWFVAIATLLLFVFALLPQLKRTFLENLQSKANGVIVSLRDVAAGAVVSEDYSTVVDHCTEMLKGDPAIDYIVITRNDGFSLVLARSAWNSRTLDAAWRPAERVPAGGIATVPLFNRRVYAYSQPFDYSGIEWGWIHVGLSLDAYDRNIVGLYRQTALLAVVCVVFSLGVSMVYAKLLVRPILSLRRTVRRVASGDLSARAPVDREDEIGSLAASVNTMTEALLRRDRFLKEANETLELRVHERTRELQDQVAARERANRELADAQRRLMQLSREAGMAEVATGVLHNVGNVLNSVNVSAILIRDTLHASELSQFAHLVELVELHRHDLPRFMTEDERGRLIVPFIGQLAAQLGAERTRLLAELSGLTQNIEHIKEIVAMQQGIARTAALLEQVGPAELMNHALAIHQSVLAHHNCQVRREFAAALPTVTTDRHNVVQILTNFVANAVHATKTNPDAQREITTRLVLRDADNLAFSVIDNGIGIAPENLPHIFRLGFTTRKDGHGFGLHAGALAAKALGGSVEVYSAGPGQGATFTLVIPLQTEAQPS